jgi:hypothetical protein
MLGGSGGCGREEAVEATGARDAGPAGLRQPTSIGRGANVTDTRSQQPQRWARCPPALAWKRPGLPTEWVRMLKFRDKSPSNGRQNDS